MSNGGNSDPGPAGEPTLSDATSRFHTFQPDALVRLNAHAEGWTESLRGRLGATARANRTFFSHRVVTTAIQRLRIEVLDGAVLTPTGEEFLFGAAAYLAQVAVDHWRRHGLTVQGRVRFPAGGRPAELFFEASRLRDNTRESYAHDFWRDASELLLRPPDWFPFVGKKVYRIESLTLPSPEQLYLYGVCLLQSPRALPDSQWPAGSTPGGRPEDFERSKELLIDDLHEDCGLPKADPALRQLSLWIVFPPYGWTQNEVNAYNLMTVVSQISERHSVPTETGIDYFRALLRCQAPDIRNFAARALMVYRQPPRDSIEAGHYRQAQEWGDREAAAQVMAGFQQRLEGVQATQDWWQQILAERAAWLERTPPPLSLRTAAEADPEYRELGQLPATEIAGGLRGLASLRRRFPDDWVLKVIEASYVMRGPDPARGEALLRELARTAPDCFEAHSRLGTQLKYQPGRAPEALQIYEASLERWPWNHQAVDACLWILTQGMTQFPAATRNAA